jgi:hypothetical protein
MTDDRDRKRSANNLIGNQLQILCQVAIACENNQRAQGAQSMRYDDDSVSSSILQLDRDVEIGKLELRGGRQTFHSHFSVIPARAEIIILCCVSCHIRLMNLLHQRIWEIEDVVIIVDVVSVVRFVKLQFRKSRAVVEMIALG